MQLNLVTSAQPSHRNDGATEQDLQPPSKIEHQIYIYVHTHIYRSPYGARTHTHTDRHARLVGITVGLLLPISQHSFGVLWSLLPGWPGALEYFYQSTMPGRSSLCTPLTTRSTAASPPPHTHTHTVTSVVHLLARDVSLLPAFLNVSVS